MTLVDALNGSNYININVLSNFKTLHRFTSKRYVSIITRSIYTKMYRIYYEDNLRITFNYNTIYYIMSCVLIVF